MKTLLPRSCGVAGHLAVACALLVLLAGCSTSQPRQGAVEREFSQGRLTTKQLSLLLFQHAATTYDVIAPAADSIRRLSEDSEIDRNALLWKINALPTTLWAVSHEDPLFGLFDIWLFNVQMHQFFESGAGGILFDSYQPMVTAACLRLVGDIRAVALEACGSPDGFQELESLVTRYAQEHPMATLTLERPAVVPEYLDLIQERRGLLNLSDTTTVYLEYFANLAMLQGRLLPEIARWQAELVLTDAPTFPVVSAPLQAVGQATELAEEAIEMLPAMVAQERQVLLQDVERQRRHTLEDIDRQRRDTLADLDRMRRDTLDGIAQEREALQEFVAAQLTNTLREIGKERAALMGDIAAITQETAAPMVPWSKELIDHLFKRLAPWLLGAGLLGALALVVLWRLGGRRRTASET